MSKDTNAPAEIKLHANTIDYATRLEAGHTVDANKNGSTASSVYEDILIANDIPVDIAKKIQTIDTHFFAACFEAAGNIGRAAASTDSAVESMNFNFGMVGKNRFDVTWTKQDERNAGIAKKGEVAQKKTVYGTLSGKVILTGTDAAVGELGKAARRQRQAATELFGVAVTEA